MSVPAAGPLPAPPDRLRGRCGPTHEQVQDALLRRQPMTTWPRCDECAAREQALLDRVHLFTQNYERPPTNHLHIGGDTRWT